jgi:hypothetical protein
MNTYNLIEISTGNILIEGSTYNECLDWIEKFGDIINYTITINV